MSDIYLDALHNYLTTEEWRHSVEVFVSTNCSYFDNISISEGSRKSVPDFYSNVQYSTWKKFQEIVEQILNSFLEKLGGSIEKLEKALDEISSETIQGPRDEVIKAVLHHLLTFENFEHFAKMMNREYNVYREKQENYDISNGNNDISYGSESKVADSNDGWQELIDPESGASYYWNEFSGETSWDPPSRFQAEQFEQIPAETPKPEGFSDVYAALLNMGFPPESIVAAMNNAGGNYSYDDLVLQLSGLQGTESAVDGGGDDAIPASTNQTMPDYFIQFIKESSGDDFKDEWLNDAAIDLSAKFNMANSILTTFDEDDDSSEQILKLISWAKDMQQLYTDLIYAFNEKVPFKLMTEHNEVGLIAWYEDLESRRTTVDENSISSNILSDDELRRIADLNHIAEGGSADERTLHTMLSRSDELNRDLAGLHRKLGLLIAKDKGINRGNIEQLYFFLKEQVANGIDLTSAAEDLHDEVYSLVSSAKAGEVISILLEIAVFEDEQTMIKRQIFTFMNTHSGAGPLTQAEEAAAFQELDMAIASENKAMFMAAQNDSTKGNEAAGTGAEAESKSSNSAASDDLQVQDKADSKESISDTAASKDSKDVSDLPVGSKDDSKDISYDAAAKEDSKNGSGDVPAKEAVPAIPAVNSNSAVDELLKEMKEKHKQALTNLQSIVDGEKLKKVKSLEDRLMLRKLQLADRKKAADSVNSEIDADTEQRLITALKDEIGEIQTEIEEAHVNAERTKEGLSTGFKKKCLNEIKAIKKLGEVRPLTEEELRECNRGAAESVKDRFEKNQLSLLDSLENERTKQRNKLLGKLAEKKGRLKNPADVAELEESVQADLNKMNKDFDDKEAFALKRAQEDVLLALSSIYMDDSLLKPTPVIAKEPAASKEDDEDEYFDGDSPSDAKAEEAARIAKATDWLSRVDQIKGTYITASQELQQRLRQAHREASSEIEEEALSSVVTDDGKAPVTADVPDDTYCGVATHMMKVITEAFDNQISDRGQADGSDNIYVRKKTANAQRAADAERAKAGILDEFEKAKQSYDDSLAAAKTSSQSKLRDRMKQRGDKASSANEDISAAVNVQATLETVVDAFLTDPVNFKAESVPPKRNRTQEAVKAVAIDKEMDEKGHRDATEDIKNRHREKEQLLVNDLQASMQEKKKALEDRLKKKKEQNMKAKQLAEETGNTGRIEITEREEREAESNVKKLQDALNNVISVIKSADEDKLHSVDASQLMGLLDRLMKGDDLTSLPAPVAAILTVADAKADAKGESDSKQELQHTSSVNSMDASMIIAASKKYKEIVAEQNKVEKEAHEDELKRISFVYNEQKQKLDLTMKLQQARQRQTLQRKLFDRKAQKGAGDSTKHPLAET